jgi:hypothetical protein
VGRSRLISATRRKYAGGPTYFSHQKWPRAFVFVVKRA